MKSLDAKLADIRANRFVNAVTVITVSLAVVIVGAALLLVIVGARLSAPSPSA